MAHEGTSVICSICTYALSEQPMCCLACGHVFHNNCIDDYLKTKGDCPNCRVPVTESSIRDLYFSREEPPSDPAHNNEESNTIAVLISQQSGLQNELAVKDTKIEELTNETKDLETRKSNLSRELFKLLQDSKQRQNLDLGTINSLKSQNNELEYTIAKQSSEILALKRQLEDNAESQAETIAILTSEHEMRIDALDRKLNDKTRELSERESEVQQLKKLFDDIGGFEEKAMTTNKDYRHVFTEHETKELITIDDFKSMLFSTLVNSANHTCPLDDLQDKFYTDWDYDLWKFATDFGYPTIVDLLEALPSVVSLQDELVGAVAQHNSEHVNRRGVSAEFILVCHLGSQDRDKTANLRIIPSSIEYPAARDVTATLINRNPHVIAFRIIDNGNNQYFTFEPSHGFVDAGESSEIMVICHKDPPSGYQIHVEYMESIVPVASAEGW